jgi:hypothetical protein
VVTNYFLHQQKKKKSVFCVLKNTTEHNTFKEFSFLLHVFYFEILFLGSYIVILHAIYPFFFR